VTNERRIVSTDQIVDAYIELVDETGPTGPTVRALAGRLFVSPTTLYERAGPIGEVADLAAARVRRAIADRLTAVSDGDSAPIVEWISANRNRALFALNPHRPGHDAAPPAQTEVLAIVGAFVTSDAEILDPQSLVDTVACLPDAATIRTKGMVASHAADRAGIILDRIDDDVLTASAQLITTSGVDAWTFRAVGELIDRSPSSLHATRPKSQVFLDLCSAVDAQARQVAEAPSAAGRSGEIEACYFALRCHSVEREVYPHGPALPTRDQVVRRHAIQIAANAPSPTPAIVAAGAAAFAASLGDLLGPTDLTR